VEKRRRLRATREIAADVEEEPVRRVGRHGDQALRELQEPVGRVESPGEGGREQEDRDRGRQETADAALVEPREAEPALGHLGRDERGDEIAGDDEEDVDTHEAAGPVVEPGVEQQHDDDGQGAKPIHVRAVGEHAGRPLHRQGA